MKKIFLLQVMIISLVQLKAQSLNTFSNDVFTIVKEADTSRIFTIMINPEADKSIMTGSTPMPIQLERNEASLRAFEQNIKLACIKMNEKGKALGIDWKIATMQGYEFSVLYSDQLKLATGNGKIKIQSNTDTFFIEIKSMVEVANKNWKIFAIDIIK